MYGNRWWLYFCGEHWVMYRIAGSLCCTPETNITLCVNTSIKNIFLNVYLFLRDRESTSGGGAEREREIQNLKQAPGSELSAQSPMQGSNSRTMRSWPERSRMLNRPSHPGTPFFLTFIYILFEFILGYSVRKLSRFILLHLAVHFSQHHCWTDWFFFIRYSFFLCQRLIGHTFVGPFLGSLFCSLMINKNFKTS